MGFKLTHKLPKRCLVAVSGGIDSMSALHFMSQVPDRVAAVIHVNHGSDHAKDAEAFVKTQCENMEIDLTVLKVEKEVAPGESLENFWRDARYECFQDAWESLGNLPIILAHTLDDCLEEYIMCTMIRGFSGTIPYAHGPCVRPFRNWLRTDIEKYAKQHGVQSIADPGNNDATFKRVWIRRYVVPRIRNLNPGIYRIVSKVILEQDERDQETQQERW